MRAVVFHSAFDVRVDDVPDPTLDAAEDILLRVTATAICGCDLYLYRSRVPALHPGDILGHEFMGIVEEAGTAVTRVRRGDRVVVPFTIACGECFFCQRQLDAACEITNPGQGSVINRKSTNNPGALFSYTHLYGGYAGGQAEYVRVPHANSGPLRIPDELPDEQVLFLSDILPTGYQAVENAGLNAGASLAIFGAGPVGLMAAACARLLGVERIFMIDHHPDRLDFARRTYHVETINFDETDDPAEHIVEETSGRGVDASIDAVGFEARGCPLETALTRLRIQTSSGKALRQAIAATRRGGVISVAGVYAGFIHGSLFDDAFDKGISFRMGQTQVQRYMPRLLEYIRGGDLDPQVIITHRLPLAKAAHGYEVFNQKRENCRKVVLRP